jgi:hypothetical protein
MVFSPRCCFFRRQASLGMGRQILPPQRLSWPCSYPTIFALIVRFISDLLFTCVRLHTICFLLSHFVSEVQGSMSLLISLFFPPDNQPKITEAIKMVLKDDYNYDSTVRLFLLHWPCLTDLKSLEHLPSTLSHLYAMLLYWRRRRYSVLQEQEWSGNAHVGSGCIGRRKFKKRKIVSRLPSLRMQIQI